MSTPRRYQELLATLKQLPKCKSIRSKANRYEACCPAHDDHDPSLGISIADDGRLLLICRAGCSAEAIVKALDFTTADLFPPSVSSLPHAARTSRQQRPPVVTRYQAITADGEVVGVHLRKDFLNADGAPYQAKDITWIQHSGRSSKSMPLYGLPALLKAAPDAPVILVEGEKAAEAVSQAGALAVGTMTGASSIPCDESLRPLLGREVILWPDNDDSGRQHMQRIAHRLIVLGMPSDAIKWMNWPDAPPKGDAADYLATGGAVAEIAALIEPLPAAQEGSDAGKDETPLLLGNSLADVEVEEIHWLWHQRIALGKVTMVDGDPGLGKSLATLDIAARVAMGNAMPDGSPGLGKPAGVVLICGEDGLADTVKPRLLAAGARPEALKRIRAINLVPEPHPDGTTSERLISLLGDLHALEATIRATDARLLVVDPITAYLGSATDMYKDADLRQVLTPLALMAERAKAAVLLVRHLNKSTNTPALHRGLGGVGFIGVARLGLLFAPNPDVEGEILVSRHKGNIGAPPPTLAYRIVQVDEAENMPRLSWLGERATSAGTALATQTSAAADSEMRSATDEAIEWLRAYLADEPRPAKEVQAAARADGITEKTLRTARLRTCKKPDKEGMRGGWMWELDPAKMSFLSHEGIFGDNDSASPDLMATPPKMPFVREDGHLRTETPPKMPTKNEGGHLRADTEFKGIGDAPGGTYVPKMPSPRDMGTLADVATDEEGFADVDTTGNGDAA